MAENVVENLSSPPTPEVGPVEYSRPEWQFLAETVKEGIDTFALAKISSNLADVEAKTENYYETSLQLYEKIENAPDMVQSERFRKELERLQVAEVQGVMSTQAADIRQDALARDYIARFPHLEDQIKSTMTDIRAGSSGRKKADQIVADPFIEMRKKLFALSAETNIPVPMLKDIAQRKFLLDYRKQELEFKKAMGDNMEGAAFGLAQEIADGVADNLWDVISNDGSGSKLGASSYNTAQGRQRLLAASTQGVAGVRRALQQELDKHDIPVTKALLESVEARWRERVSDFEDIVDAGNNFQVIEQRSKVRDIVALDRVSGGNDQLRLILKNPDLFDVVSKISLEARRAFTFNPDGSITPKESGFPQLLARGKAGDPTAMLSMFWLKEQSKLHPGIVDDFADIFERGVAPVNPFPAESPLHGEREEATTQELARGLEQASTPEVLGNVVTAMLDPKRETDRRKLATNPELLLNPNSLFRSKVLDNRAFMGTEQGQRVSDQIVNVISSEAESRVLRNRNIGDLSELSISGTAEAPFVFRGAPVSSKFVTRSATGVGLPIETVKVENNPGKDAADYLNRAYGAIKSFDPKRAEDFKNEAEREIKREIGRRASAIRSTTPSDKGETIIELTDEDFAGLE